MLSSRAANAELALVDAESAGRTDRDALRETDGARQRALGALDDAVGCRDDALARLEGMRGDVAMMRARLGELEALEATHREDEVRIASLQARAADLETDLARSQSETETGDEALSRLRSQACLDLELAQQSTARVSAELMRIIKVREDDAEQATQIADSSRRTIAQLQGECDASASETGQLRDRCRSLQSQAAQLAAEVQDSRDASRRFHDEAIEAKALLQVRRRGSAS